MDPSYYHINIDMYKKEIEYHQKMIAILNEKIKDAEKQIKKMILP